MRSKRSAGVILHPTSLPGPDGIGDLGPEAYRWIDFLASTGCSYWQVLPLGPTGYGDSPYQCFSAFAGNPYLISPAVLYDQGLLTRKDLAERPDFETDRVDYGPAIKWKLSILDKAFEHFKELNKPELIEQFMQFQYSQSAWLKDFALFMAIKEAQGGGSWDHWSRYLRSRGKKVISEFIKENQNSIQRFTFQQFLFFRQWTALRKYANSKGIKLIGDVPIFIAYDSADTWSHPELFYLNKSGKPTVVAGVPPDYFSPTGQLWGNPLYRWDIHAQTGYAWWIDRVRATCQLFDTIRLDHFRGFAGYWEVPAGMPTAEVGRWVPGPGINLFTTIKKALGPLPIIAEDLGEITPDVIELREQLALPGMKILQFAFSSDADDAFLPHNYLNNCVAYTGTHDNDTSTGWYQSASEKERDFCRRYIASSGIEIAWDMIRVVWGSVAFMTLTTMQDLLAADTDARMNFPGRPTGNWCWRMPAGVLTEKLRQRLYEFNYLYGRMQ
jgi:4-alpha-glucanotransferase